MPTPRTPRPPIPNKPPSYPTPPSVTSPSAVVDEMASLHHIDAGDGSLYSYNPNGGCPVGLLLEDRGDGTYLVYDDGRGYVVIEVFQDTDAGISAVRSWEQANPYP